MQKYVIFNPINGTHISINSIEEARQEQINSISQYVQTSVIGMFSCNIETTNEDGSKTWEVFDLELEKEVSEIVKELVRKNIVDYFDAGLPIHYDAIKEVLIEEGLIQEQNMYDIKQE